MTPIAKPLAFTKPIICYVTDRASLPVESGASREDALLACIQRISAAGANWIELREKDLDSRPLLDLTRKALLATRSGGAPESDGGSPKLLLNDRLDIARIARADGVHLTEKSLPVAAVSSWRNSQRGTDDEPLNFLVGASCHSLAGALRAASDGADYIFFGPVFATPSKAAFGPPQGLTSLTEVCRAVNIPVIAIGGVTTETVAACMEAGAAGIAAIALFQQPRDLPGLLTTLRAKLR